MDWEKVFALKDSDIDTAIDILFEHVDDLLCAGEFAKVDDIIRQADVTRMDTFLLVAVLSCTCCAKDILKEYPGLVERVEQRLLEIAPDRLELLMEGFRYVRKKNGQLD
jgi:hypothetical protein